MNNDSLIRDFVPARLSVNDLVARHGAWRVFLAAFAALLAPRRGFARLGPVPLSDYLRRDIGLMPSTPPPVHWLDRR